MGRIILYIFLIILVKTGEKGYDKLLTTHPSFSSADAEVLVVELCCHGAPDLHGRGEGVEESTGEQKTLKFKFVSTVNQSN